MALCATTCALSRRVETQPRTSKRPPTKKAAFLAKLRRADGVELEVCTRLLATINVGPWPQSDKEELSACVRQVAAGTPRHDARSGKLTPRLQQFSSLEHFLPPSLVEYLSSAEPNLRSKFQRLSEFLLRLGLRAPSEATTQHIMSVALCVCQHDVVSPSQRLGCLVDFKSVFKASAKYAGPVCDQIVQYPGTPNAFRADFPATYEAAYKNEGPGPSPVPADALREMRTSIPMRRSRSSLVLPGSANSSIAHTANAAMDMMRNIQLLHQRPLEFMMQASPRYRAKCMEDII